MVPRIASLCSLGEPQVSESYLVTCRNEPICVAEVLSQGIIPPASSCYLTAGLVGLQLSAIFPIAFLSYSLLLCVLNAISGRALPFGLMFMNSTPMTFCFYVTQWPGGEAPYLECVLSFEKCLSDLYQGVFCFCSEGYEGIVGIPAHPRLNNLYNVIGEGRYAYIYCKILLPTAADLSPSCLHLDTLSG